MSIHFPAKDLAARRKAVDAELTRRGLDGLLDRPVGEIDDAHRRALDAAGLEEHLYAACGHSLGTTFSPNWMDWPILFLGNSVPAELLNEGGHKL